MSLVRKIKRIIKRRKPRFLSDVKISIGNEETGFFEAKGDVYILNDEFLFKYNTKNTIYRVQCTQGKIIYEPGESAPVKFETQIGYATIQIAYDRSYKPKLLNQLCET